MKNKKRCDWAEQSEGEKIYHDTQWGIPLHDDTQLFEMLVLESMQAGLSWATILNKREHFCTAFDHFNIATVAAYNEQKIYELLENTGIVRNKLKITAAINNAKRILKIQEQESFDSYLWKLVDNQPIINYWQTIEEVPASTELSATISKKLKKEGFQFLGPTIVYSFMQATGMINDHLTTCFCHPNNKQ